MKHQTVRYDDDVLKGIKNQEQILVQYFNCSVLRERRLIKEDFWVENGKIVNPEPIFFVQKRKPDLRVDCQGKIIAAGYIDIQINGGFGVDFSSDAEKLSDNIAKVAKQLIKFGVTSFCPTIVSSSAAFYKKAIEQMKYYSQDRCSSGFLGLHFEGPFINKEKKGAHADQHFVNGFKNGIDDLSSVYGHDLSAVCLITLAPELPNSLDVIQNITSSGIKVSLGHSIASITVGEEAINAGASCITHLFNAMLPFHHRDPGLVGLLTSAKIANNKTLYFGVISDGVHTHDAALRIAHRTHPDGLILVTDAVALLGLSEGTHHLGDMTIEVKDRKALIAGTETITGSISPMDYCVRHFQKAARCNPCEALTCASLHPAQLLGLENKKGQLNFGSDADFLILTENLDVLATYIAGMLVWNQLG